MLFGAEIILREFSVDALFAAGPDLGSRPFLSGFPARMVPHDPRDHLLVALLAVVLLASSPMRRHRLPEWPIC